MSLSSKRFIQQNFKFVLSDLPYLDILQFSLRIRPKISVIRYYITIRCLPINYLRICPHILVPPTWFPCGQSIRLSKMHSWDCTDTKFMYFDVFSESPLRLASFTVIALARSGTMWCFLRSISNDLVDWSSCLNARWKKFCHVHWRYMFPLPPNTSSNCVMIFWREY